MGTCEVCGNSFECAIQKLAPTCAHCARASGEMSGSNALRDRV